MATKPKPKPATSTKGEENVGQNVHPCPQKRNPPKPAKKEFPPKHTDWTCPIPSVRNPAVNFLTACNRTYDHEVDSLIAMWKTLPISAKERIFIHRHLVYPVESSYYWWASTELLWILRRIFIEIDWNGPEGENRLRRAFNALTAIVNIGDRGQTTVERKWFGEIGLSASIKSIVGANPGDHADKYSNNHDMALLRLLARDNCMVLYRWAIHYYISSNQFADKARALRKIGVTAMRYSVKDRQRITDLLDGKTKRDRVARGDGPPLYLERLYETVGKEQFEKLIFGTTKVCGTCGVTNRQKPLLCCNPCAKEGVHPKRRYCGEECQRADWVKHREFHAALGHKLGVKKSGK